ncbi:dihydrofolate reductase family protein [Frankia sp. CNm7]|uniref:Dihydrofolate reductase family protein n=1 Tax=Frankia nepalensis TaxID=1836974 RepID=A0A937RWA2_9ACTN|nr:dihydrofolate reductase family protein [Frankia nepalensis]MBL7498549.1 dihydrofolate reductase family protein [Frankia nepalensis]MBL7515817.1 dihydrofolate reductase family protein [Frankia nepalensis]MBL7521872.1 dihydrofolate reductase family protein [Frankia nepalensis]MBL7633011.1 dihydrofolate reductase family protein [Frankia nepalensis]
MTRRFKLQTQVTVDGYMGGPKGEMDWMTFGWSDDLKAYADELVKPVDCIVLGRRLAEGFIPAWESRPEGEDEATIDWMNNTPRVVVSKTLTASPWKNATIAGGDLVETVNELKSRPGGDLIAYGGSGLVTSLIAADLLDELHLFVNPVAIGAGIPVFPTTGGHKRFDVVAARPFECGITVLRLEPKRS